MHLNGITLHSSAFSTISCQFTYCQPNFSNFYQVFLCYDTSAESCGIGSLGTRSYGKSPLQQFHAADFSFHSLIIMYFSVLFISPQKAKIQFVCFLIITVKFLVSSGMKHRNIVMYLMLNLWICSCHCCHSYIRAHI